MKKRYFRVRVLSGVMVAMMAMSSLTPLMVNAAELPEEEQTVVEEISDETMPEEPTEEPNQESTEELAEANEESDQEDENEDEQNEEAGKSDESEEEANITEELKTAESTEELEKEETTEEEKKDEYFVVSFIDSIDNITFATVEVNKNESVTELPEAPAHEGYKFYTYDGNYRDVIQNEEVTAIYVENEKLPPRHERIFAEIDGVYVEHIIESQDEELDIPWKDEEGNEYIWMDDCFWHDMNGHRYMPDKTYIDSYYGEMFFGDSGNEMVNESKKLAQSEINTMLDYISKTNPAFSFIAGPLKTLIAEMFGQTGSKDPNKIIIDKLSDIEKQLTDMEDNQKYHVEDALTMAELGGDFQELAKRIDPLYNKINDSIGNYEKGDISKEQCQREIAALRDSNEYANLTAAISGASKAFFGDTNYTIDKRSIFGATYNLQCNHVMFSGEAIDKVTPYLIRQLCNYLRAYGLVNTVLDNYEAVVGNNAALSTREEMLSNTGGVLNGTFNPEKPGVFGQFKKFLELYRYTYVGCSSDPYHHVRLNEKIAVCIEMPRRCIGTGVYEECNLEKYTPDGMKNFPLSSTQMKNLASYCARKHISVYDLLIDVVGFKLTIVPDFEIFTYLVDKNVEEITGDSKVAFGDKVYTFDEIMRESSATYMPTGPQIIELEVERKVKLFGSRNMFNNMQAIQINRVGATDEKVRIGIMDGKGRVNATVLFFMR